MRPKSIGPRKAKNPHFAQEQHCTKRAGSVPEAFCRAQLGRNKVLEIVLCSLKQLFSKKQTSSIEGWGGSLLTGGGRLILLFSVVWGEEVKGGGGLLLYGGGVIVDVGEEWGEGGYCYHGGGGVVVLFLFYLAFAPAGTRAFAGVSCYRWNGVVFFQYPAFAPGGACVFT